MPRKFLALNVVLAALSAVLIAYIARQLLTPTPLPVGGRRAAATTVVPPAVETPRAPAGAYTVVAARNLFNPARSESPGGATTTAAAAPLVRPNLFGIVVRDGASVAYLEDPVTKRVVGYRVGDRVVGGTVQTIKADSIVIERSDGPIDVRLRDPGKPRAVATPGPGGAPQLGPAQLGAPQPGTFQPAQPAAAALPGVIPPAGAPLPQPPQAIQPQFPQSAQQPGVVAPGTRSPAVAAQPFTPYAAGHG